MIRLEPPLAPNNDLTTPTDVVPPTLVQPGDHKAQTKMVLRHARAELIKEVGQAGYNDLVVERWVFSFTLFLCRTNF